MLLLCVVATNKQTSRKSRGREKRCKSEGIFTGKFMLSNNFLLKKTLGLRESKKKVFSPSRLGYLPKKLNSDLFEIAIVCVFSEVK